MYLLLDELVYSVALCSIYSVDGHIGGSLDIIFK